MVKTSGVGNKVTLTNAVNKIAGVINLLSDDAVALKNSVATRLGIIDNAAQTGVASIDIDVTGGNLTLTNTIRTTGTANVAAAGGLVEGVDAFNNPVGLIDAAALTLNGGTGTIGDIAGNLAVQITNNAGNPIQLSASTTNNDIFLQASGSVLLGGSNSSAGTGGFALRASSNINQANGFTLSVIGPH